MIKIIPGSIKINKFRLINIYEADYNLTLKYFWSHKATNHVEQSNLLDEAQWDSRLMGIAKNAALIYERITEISRMTCTPLAKLQNDAVACFDRQVNSHAMLNSRKYEVPDQACKLLSATLH